MNVRRCDECGAELAGDGTSRTCPRCALQLALDSTAAGPPATVPAPSSRSAGAPAVDRYTLVRKLGEGGMGEVWLARQREPVRRDVALKIIKRGMDSELFVARFERERQTLALMNHPAVARIFDAGATADGLPYFVMEYVPGEPIHEHCRKYDLPLDERLRLFGEVCDAVHHAHQKAIVHRDLKPTNVLVTRDGGRSFPKIIDFGVSKALGRDLSDRTLYTEVGVLIGTPEYMSPEQARAGDDAVDTRTDVYSLGVILYELISGGLPFDSKRLRESGYDGIRRVILDEEPPRPSIRAGTLGGDARGLRGDLDWITMKALAKEPERRYASCAEFAADIERHLHEEPVIAGPPSASYRAGKFVRRHRPAVVTAAAIVVLMIVGLVVTTTLWRDARRQRRLAEERFDRVMQLSDLKRVSDATADADDLWPAHPENIAAIEAWIETEGRPLADALPAHRATLAELRSRALPYDEETRRRDVETHPRADELEGYRLYVEEKLVTVARLRAEPDLEDRDEIVRHYEGRIEEVRALAAELEPIVNARRTWAFPDHETQWEHDMLADLVARLEEFTDPDPFVGALASVRGRLEFARTIEERSLLGEQVARSWAAAVRAIEASPDYGGLVIEPQIGLVPLGEDPESGLWEFWHLATGERPAPRDDRDGTGGWRIGEETGMVFVLVPGGRFRMGAQNSDPGAPNFDPAAERRERGVHEVELSAYFLSKYEMTQGQWKRLTGEEPSRHDATTEMGDHVVDLRHPVELVGWEESTELMRRHALALPTEAQWEYAARAGTSTPWWTGEDARSLRGAANLADLSLPRSGAPSTIAIENWLDDDHVVHAPVGSFAPNPFGLFDVHGNVFEFCREHYVSPYRGTERPGDGYQLVAGGTGSHVYRGGSWKSLAVQSRVSARGNQPVGTTNTLIGLRPARAVVTGLSP